MKKPSRCKTEWFFCLEIGCTATVGKIFYNGAVKTDEYTISKMISRMRGGGGGTPPPVPPAV
jgi:hypothetical protein